MIKKAVFSYINFGNSYDNKSGFARFSDFLYTTALAVLCASRVFPKVEMVTDRWGMKLFKSLKLPITEYSDELQEIHNVPRPFWAYAKMIAYTKQKEPFVHVDNDVFLFEALPKRILDAELCFQSREDFYVKGYHYYHKLIPCFNEAPVKPEKIAHNMIDDYAYNCGICGGHNLDFFKEWRQCSEKYIFAKENQSLFFDTYKSILIHQNLMHEQYFGAVLVNANGLRDKVEVIGETVADIEKTMKYTHVWGTGKLNTHIMSRVYMRLMREETKLFIRISDFLKDNNIP